MGEMFNRLKGKDTEVEITIKDGQHTRIIRADSVENLLQAMFPNESALVKAGKCPFCSCPVNVDDFRDDLSKKEFNISGLCQKCQDGQFGIY